MTTKQSTFLGFTMVETLVVVSLLSLVSSIVLIAAFGAQKREQVNAITIGLAGWLEEVRRSALRGNSCEILITTGIVSTGSSIAKVDGGITCANLASPFIVPPEASGSTYTVSATPTNFSFTPRGTKHPPEDVVLTVAMNNKGPRRCIRVRGILGNLEIGNIIGNTCGETRF